MYTNQTAFLGAINAGYYREVIPNAVFEELRSNNLPESRNFSSNGFSYALFSPGAPPNAGLYPTTVSGTFNGTNSDFVICASYPHLGLLLTNFSPNISAVGGNFFPLDWGDRFTNTPISVTATLVNGSIYETNYFPGGVTSYLGLAFSGQSIASLRILNATNSPTEEYITINNFTAATIGKTNATVALGNLLQTFNGSARPATATTTPSGLAVALTYNGSSAAPINAGTYSVVAAINDANYQGNASGTLQIAKADQTISFTGPGNLTFGTPAVSLSGTATSELPLTYSVVSGPGSIAGTNLNVTGAGTIVLRAAQAGNGNYDAASSVDVTITVAKAVASVTLSNLHQTFNGAVCPVTVTTTPAGLTTTVLYNGSPTVPTDAGTYIVSATIDDPNYEGSAGDALTIGKAAASVALGGLSHTYDGSAKSATATTTPEGLAVELAYDGNGNAPTNAGTYAVAATISDPNYEGSTADTLVIGKATAGIALGDLSQTYDGSAKSVTATTTPEGLIVEVAYDGGPNAPTNAGTYAVAATINDANYEGSASDTLSIGKATATVTLGDLAQTYDGMARSATVTTAPEGLAVDLTYDGSADAPANAGSYAVAATINDPNYEGSASDTLTIGKAVASITIGGLSQTYDGNARSATVATAPEGLVVEVTYDGSANAPVNAGSYAVTATINDANYEGSASDTLNIGKATAAVTLDNLLATYDGSAKSASATTDPVGLTVGVTYDGSATAPTNAGSYAVVATIDDANYVGTASGSLEIGKAVASIAIGDLNQTYDGSARTVSATTTPEGLAVDLTYDGSADAPVNAGTYAVAATINDANYEGTSSESLTIGKAEATVALGDLAQTYDGSVKAATATTTPEGLAVDLTYDGNADAPANAGTYAVVATIDDANYVGTASGSLEIGKATAAVTLESLTATYDGTAKVATATTTPEGLTVGLTYDGSATAPTNAGMYAVVATINDANYTGTASGSLEIGKATASIALGDLSQTYDGNARSATVITTPEGLAVDVTYDGNAQPPTNAGTYAVAATINDANYEGFASDTLSIGKATASIALGDLSQTYDGNARSATVITTPEGLAVDVTYDGNAQAPTNAGTYAVAATINDANYEGFANETLTIAKATASVTLGDLSQTYDGAEKPVSVTTTPEGLNVDVTYDGNGQAPANAGTYAVVATINDANYEGFASDALSIGKATASIALGDLSQTYDGNARSATVITTPEDLAVDVTYDGNAQAPANAGSYAITVTINDANYEGSASDTLTIGKATASIAIGDLSQTYDGSARTVSVTTTPEGLAVDVAYDGGANAPTNAGTYAVTATISDPNYEGSAGDTLTIGKAAASVALGGMIHTYDGSAKSATATTTPEGLAVELTYDGNDNAPTNAGTYAVAATISDPNYEGSTADTLVIGKAIAGIALGDLSQTYDGTPAKVSATTTPEGLAVDVTYDGNAESPVNAGSYAVTATISDPNYEGSTADTLVIGKAIAGIALGDLSQTYDGSARTVSATTTPAGLKVNLTYDGSATAPIAAGSYAVVATIDDANYVGSASNTLVIAKATANVQLSNLSQTYDGTAKSASSSTTPGGLSVSLTYAGSATAPTNAGTYAVVATINDPNYQGSATGSLVIAKATANVALANLAQTYDGSAKSATATTTPSGLNVALTYDGSSNPPTNAGSYVVGALIDDPNYNGSASGTLVIAKASASVVLANLAQTYDGGAKSATATTTPSGLNVSFTYNGSALLPTNAGTYSVVATIDNPNYAGSASGTLQIAKANQTISFTGPGNLTFGVSPVALTGSATSGLPLAYSVVSGPGSINGTTLNVTGAGTIVLRAAQTGNGNYNAASSVEVTVAVAKAAATINLSNLGQTFNGSPRPVTVTTTPAGLSTTVLYNASATVPSQVGQYTVGVTVNDPNYEGSSTGTLVIYYAESSLAVVNPNAVNEGRLVTLPIRLSSAGEVGGLTFRIQYDPTYLKAPEFKWLGRSALGLADVVVNEAEGIIDATVSLNGLTYLSGVADVAEIKLRTRSVPLSSVLTPVEVTINDASDANGTTLDNVIGALNGAITINRRTFVGDVNGNGFLDISDATGILRLLSGAEPGVAPTQTRPWDTALNDVNQNGSLTSGDVTALLSLISRRGTPPSLVTPRTLRTLSLSGFETSTAPLPEFNPQPVGNAIRAMSAAATESARLSSRVYSAANGTVTVQLIVDNLTSPITGLSFQLNYPKDSLRLAGVNAMQTGTLIPSSGVSRNWNLSTQAEFDAQTGAVRLAAASGTEWSNTSGIAATLVFNVLNDGGRDVFQTISVTDFAVSYLQQGGVELRNIAVSDAFFQRTIAEWATNNQVGSTTATDTDKDGASDLAEYLAGTDPKSQLSRFSVREIRRPGGAVTRVQWATVKGVRYRVTTSTNLASWSLVAGSETDGTGAVTEIDISGSASEPKRFFRVEIAP